MKNPLPLLAGAVLLSFLTLTTPVGQAQTTSVDSATITPSLGVVNEFTPDVISVRTEAAPAPVVYHYTKTTTYVDENGVPVSVETVKSGLPVTVYYTKEGDALVASKVIVRKAVATVPVTPVIEEKTTTTTTTIER